MQVDRYYTMHVFLCAVASLVAAASAVRRSAQTVPRASEVPRFRRESSTQLPPPEEGIALKFEIPFSDVQYWSSRDMYKIFSEKMKEFIGLPFYHANPSPETMNSIHLDNRLEVELTARFQVKDFKPLWSPNGIMPPDEISFECTRKTEGSCLATCKSKDIRGQNILEFSGCLKIRQSVFSANYPSNLFTKNELWCHLDIVGNFGTLDKAMYSGSVIVPMAISLCEMFGFDLQDLHDAAGLRCDGYTVPKSSSSGKTSGLTDLEIHRGSPNREGGDPDIKSLEIHPFSDLMMFRKGLSYYQKFGFVPCKETRERSCQNAATYVETRFQNDAVLDIIGKFRSKVYKLDDRTHTVSCFNFLTNICGAGGRIGSCISGMLSRDCPRPMSNPLICGLSAAISDELNDFYKPKLIAAGVTVDYDTVVAFCRKSNNVRKRSQQLGCWCSWWCRWNQNDN